MKIVARTEAHHLRCEFTEGELREFSKTMARETQDLAMAEINKKVANAQFAEEIARHQSIVSKMARNINTGYEMRLVQCEVLLDTPERGSARIVRSDTGEVIKERAMTEGEIKEALQGNLPLAVNPPGAARSAAVGTQEDWR